MNKRILFRGLLGTAVIFFVDANLNASLKTKLLAGAGQHNSAIATAASSSLPFSEIQAAVPGVGQGDYAKAVHKAGTFGKVEGLALTHAMEHVIDPMVAAHDPAPQIWAQIQKLMSSKHTPEQKSHFYGELADYIINKAHVTHAAANRSWTEAQTYGIPAGAFLAGVHALFAAGQHPHLAPAPANLMAAITAYGLSRDDLLNWIHQEIHNAIHNGHQAQVGKEMRDYDIPPQFFLFALDAELANVALGRFGQHGAHPNPADARALHANLVQDAEQFGYHPFDIALGIIEWQYAGGIDNVWAHLHAAHVDADTFVKALAKYHDDNGGNLDNVYQDVAACARVHAGTISLANMMNVGVAKWNHDGRQGSILAHATHHGMTEVQFLTALYEAQHVAHGHDSYVQATLAETAKHLGIDLNAFVHLVETIGGAGGYNALPHGGGHAYRDLGSALVGYGVPHGNAAANKAYVEAVIAALGHVHQGQVYANCVTNGGAMTEEEFVHAVEAISGANTLHAEAVTRFGMTDAEFMAAMHAKHGNGGGNYANSAHHHATNTHNMPHADALAVYLGKNIGAWADAHAHGMTLDAFVAGVHGLAAYAGHGTLGAALVAYGVPHGNLQEHEEFIKLVAAHVPVNQVYANVVTSGAMNEQEFVHAVEAISGSDTLHAEAIKYGMGNDEFIGALAAIHHPNDHLVHDHATNTHKMPVDRALDVYLRNGGWLTAHQHGMKLEDFATGVYALGGDYGTGVLGITFGGALARYGVPHGTTAERLEFINLVSPHVGDENTYTNTVVAGVMTDEEFVAAVENLTIDGNAEHSWETAYALGMTGYEFVHGLIALELHHNRALNTVWNRAAHDGMNGEEFVASVFVLENESLKRTAQPILDIKNRADKKTLKARLLDYGMANATAQHEINIITPKVANSSYQQTFALAEGLTPLNRQDAPGVVVAPGSALSTSLPYLAAAVGNVANKNIPVPVVLVLHNPVDTAHIAKPGNHPAP